MAMLASETRIVVGRVAEPGDPKRPWWWQSTTTIQGAEATVAGYAATESDALLEATASTLDLQAAYAAAREPATPADREKSVPSEVEIWAGTGNGSSASAQAGEGAIDPVVLQPTMGSDTGN
jgi:hypothetical protein